jgi:hypothetical protein
VTKAIGVISVSVTMLMDTVKMLKELVELNGRQIRDLKARVEQLEKEKECVE